MADLGFDGKVAIITGAGGGLGRSHALELAKRGALIVVNDLGGSVDGQGGSHTAAQQVVDEIKAAGGEAAPNYDSVATPEGGQAIVQTAIDAYGRVDIVINNAGILRDASFKNMTKDNLEPVLDVHLKGAFYVTQPAWQLMRDQGYGRIVNTSSGAGVFGNFGQTNYGAAKMGLVGFTRVLAVEGAKNNIKANAIAPVAKTRMTEDILGPIAEKMAPEFVTPLVTYLAHEDCPVTGEVYSVGGGRVARVFIGVTAGYTDPKLTPESVRDHFDEIRDEKDYAVPANLNEELGLALKALPSGRMGIPRFDATASGDEVAGALLAHGAAIVERLVSGETSAQLRDELAPWIEKTPAGDDEFSGRTTRRTGALLARSRTSQDLIAHPLVLDAVDKTLWPSKTTFQLHLTQAITIGPGSPAQQLHRDQWCFDFFEFPDDVQVEVGTMWALDEFTEANGATRVALGSHLEQVDLKTAGDFATAPAEMPPGSIVLYTGRTVHGGGANTTDTDRIGINVDYAVGWLRQEENQYLSVPVEIARELPEHIQRLMGYRHGAYALGYIDDARDPIEVLRPSDGQPRGQSFNAT